MHFYIDESGNTGNNLFDERQPTLHYGVLSSKDDLDVTAAAAVAAARQKLGGQARPNYIKSRHA